MTNSILAAIGNTPIVEIKKLNPNPNVKLLAKLEYFNPGGSIKDRTALYMIEEAEKSGLLTTDKTVIEATSGNTGIGLALVCSVKGYKLLLTMSEAVSAERQKVLKARGAEILLTPGHLGTDGAIDEVYRLALENPNIYYMTDQFNNEANCLAHYHGTAEEIWQQTKGDISMIIGTMGTTGTLMGISKRLKEYNADIKIVGVEPYLGHKIQGLKNMKEAYRPEIFEKKCLDKIVNIEDEEAFEMTRKLAKEEGLFVGMSSGAAMAIAKKEAEAMKEGTIVVIFPDGGERYLSTSLFSVQEKAAIRFFNTMSRKKEIFNPIQPGKVFIYSCGPTANTRMDMGECRRFVFADILSRYLDFRGYSVTHIMNITDMDDKTISDSEKAGLLLSEFTKKYISFFKKDLAALNIKPANEYPKTSEHIEDMVLLAKKLVNKGFAYEKLRSLYFDISRFSEYGKLSGIDINKIKIGATVDLDEYEKNNPRDFTLFKKSRLSELKRGIYVKTEWGNVRPSWPIQCTAMSMKYLGEFFDIHTSNRALVFPHHGNEIAIAQSLTGKPLAKYWIHSDQVLIYDNKLTNKENRTSLEQLYDLGFSGREIRYWLLSNHYRKPIKLSVKQLEYAKYSLKRIDMCINSLMNLKEAIFYSELDPLIYDIKHGFFAAMDDDINIAAALAALFKNIKQINILILKKMIGQDDAYKIIDVFKKIDSALGIFDFSNEVVDPEILSLIKERKKARATKNWYLADRIRDKLTSLGITVKDQKIHN